MADKTTKTVGQSEFASSSGLEVYLERDVLDHRERGVEPQADPVKGASAKVNKDNELEVTAPEADFYVVYGEVDGDPTYQLANLVE